jgi:murein DD-endopeptidase MepM/ murein hydrolase activator NlpD
MKRFLVTSALLLALSGCAGWHPNNSYPSSANLTPGEVISVSGNQNVYTIAREHNVSMRDLIAMNNLRPPFELHAGQSLTLPAGGTGFNGASMPAPAAAPLEPVDKSYVSPIESGGVSSQQLEPITAPKAPTSLAPQSSVAPAPTAIPFGQPSAAPESKMAAAPSPSPVQALNAPSVKTAAQPAATTIMNSPATPSEAAAAATGEATDMVWPVQGPILSSFGSKGPGLNNDGINIGAPKGSPVVAAAPGTVVYAGNEMKGFGNLVLIRHQGDWVTAYAHLDRVMVKKDAVVAQGDEIGTVGKTGNVASPQLHFETRSNGKPVDPAGVIKTTL